MSVSNILENSHEKSIMIIETPLPPENLLGWLEKDLGNGNNNYSCETCNQSFVSYDQLKRHAGVHSGEKPYSCETCNKSFAS